MYWNVLHLVCSLFIICADLTVAYPLSSSLLASVSRSSFSWQSRQWCCHLSVMCPGQNCVCVCVFSTQDGQAELGTGLRWRQKDS